MLELPVFSELRDARTVLLAGAGGGYDFMSGLPLYLALRAAGKTVHYANLTFTRLLPSDGDPIATALVRIKAGSGPNDTPGRYFPERYLSQWFRARGEEVPIWCVLKSGGAQVIEAYQTLHRELSPDTIILVDGGTDSLLRGDEDGLGTPVEDMLSILGAAAIPAERKMLLSLGFGIDAFHGVCHAHVLEAISDLIRAGGYLGTFSLVREMPEVAAFADALSFVHARMPVNESIVCSSIASALDGHFGDHHATLRTSDSSLFINPLMSLCFCFRLEALARRVLYLDLLPETRSFGQAAAAIDSFRRQLSTVRPARGLPM